MKIDVKKVAKLANLQINPADEPKFENQLTEILSYVEKLKEVNTDGVEITSQVTGLENITRDDKSTESLPQEIALQDAKSTENGSFKVKGILENE